MTKFNLSENLTKYNCSHRFHMPGHGGKGFGSVLDSVMHLDVTELEYTDDLGAPIPGGSIEQAYALCHELFGYEVTVFTCGGSTAAIQTLISAVACSGGSTEADGGNIACSGNKIICERKCHMAVIYSLGHCGINPVWIDDKSSGTDELEFIGAIERAVYANPEANAIVVTSPDYYGRMHNLREIRGICDRYKMALIVDSAHGAHLDFYRDGVLSAINCGATAAAVSLHKTLPALTGSAMIHSDGTDKRFSRDNLERHRRHFASSSPSFLILTSICDCLEYMKHSGTDRLNIVAKEVSRVSESLINIGYAIADYKRDPLRLCINTKCIGSAESLYYYFARHKIVCEFYDNDCVVLIPSVLHDKSDFEELLLACVSFANEPPEVRGAVGSEARGVIWNRSKFDGYKIPESAMSIRNAMLSQSVIVPIAKSVLRVCAEPLYFYPPGIPIVIPGEVISGATAELLIDCGFKTICIVT